MTVHVSQLVRGCVCQPSANSFRPQPPSSWSTASVFRVDYYNSIGLHGGSTVVSSRSVLNSAARFIIWSDTIRSYNRFAARQPTLVACSQRIAYKLCLITYNALNDRHIYMYARLYL